MKTMVYTYRLQSYTVTTLSTASRNVRIGTAGPAREVPLPFHVKAKAPFFAPQVPPCAFPARGDVDYTAPPCAAAFPCQHFAQRLAERLRLHVLCPAPAPARCFAQRPAVASQRPATWRVPPEPCPTFLRRPAFGPSPGIWPGFNARLGPSRCHPAGASIRGHPKGRKTREIGSGGSPVVASKTKRLRQLRLSL